MTNELIELCSGVYWIGVNDTETKLFEGLWEIPEGVSYNSFLVKGKEKIALIDCVDKEDFKIHLEKIEEIVDAGKIDYLIINHMEPDHTGAIPQLLKKIDKPKIVLTPIAQLLLKKFYNLESENILIKNDETKLDLGGKTLHFIETPGLHWPETMSTYLEEEKVLFSCDAFGSFQNLPENVILESEIDNIDERMDIFSRKYFTSVFNAQKQHIINAIVKFRKLKIEIEMLAPSHGPVYVENSKVIIEKWNDWSHQKGFEKKVTIAYGSMYGMTEKCIEAIVEGIEEAGGKAEIFNLSDCFPVEVLTSLLHSPGLIVGSSTYEHEIFPKVMNFLKIIETKKVAPRVTGIFGSFGWSGEATRKIKDFLTNLNFNIAESPLAFYGSPTEKDLEKAKKIGFIIANKAFEENKL